MVQAHHTHNTFYSIWSDAKDRETELTYPCAVWDSWRTWIEEDGAGALNRSVAVRLLIVTAVATDRTPGDRDAAVEAADQAAEDYILKLRELYPDMAITNVATTTQFDEYTQLETGVILSFTATGGPLCLDGSAFGPVCAAGVVVNSNGTFTLSVPSGGTATLPDVTHTDSDGTPVTLPGMVPMVCTPGSTPVATTVNGVTSDVPDITVVQGGVQVGTLDPATGVHTVPECQTPPVPGCDDLVDAVWVEGAGDPESNGLYSFDGYGGPAGIMAAKKYKNAYDHIIAANDFDSPEGPFGWSVYDQDEEEHYASTSLPFSIFPSQGGYIVVNEEQEPPPTVRQATIADLCPCDECEDATVQLQDSAGNNIGSVYFISSGDTRDITVGDSTITLPNGMTKQVKATQPYTVPQTAALKFSFSAYDQGSDLWTVTADEAGTYNAYTQDGASGTLTYSKNGGAFTALSGTITLAVGDTIQVKRTTITAAGWSRWQRQATP